MPNSWVDNIENCAMLTSSMTSKKLITLFITVCLLNPICCCIGSTDSGNLNAAEDHSCCDDSTNKDSSESCPHKAMDEASFADITVTNDFQGLSYPIVLCENVYNDIFGTENNELSSYIGSNIEQIPVLNTAQVNCFYLL